MEFDAVSPRGGDRQDLGYVSLGSGRMFQIIILNPKSTLFSDFSCYIVCHVSVFILSFAPPSSSSYFSSLAPVRHIVCHHPP